MDCCVTLILLFFGFSFNSCSHFPLRKYYYVDLKMTWTDAQQYCREKYTDLATIESMDDIYRLNSDFSYSWAWIGLRDDPQSWRGVMGHDTNSWRWSTTGETSKTGYHNWKAGEPNKFGGDESCGLLGSTGEWNDFVCKTNKRFVCYTVTNQSEKAYVFISTWTTWHSAQAYCREHHTDLAMIENTEENNKVRSAKPASAAGWIGLYRVPWTWSDKSQSSFRSWRSTQPNNAYLNQHCVSENEQHEWNDDNCNSEFFFICQQVRKLKTTLGMKIQTDADLTDPAINTQIIQQVRAALTDQGWTDFNLQWTIQPRKQETKEKLSDPQ